jgi:DNA-binding transcriptional ArsR family regulator
LPQVESLVVRDPVAIRFLGDTQKRRILREFMDEPKTALQAAHSLGMRPPTIYHHVAQLTQVGLLVLVEERRKRGTVEKYLQTPARQMTGAASVGDVDEAVELFRETFDACLQEIQSAIVDRTEPHPPIGIVHLSASVSPDRLNEFMESFRAAAKEFDGPDAKELSVMIVVHPRKPSAPVSEP